MRRFVRYPSRPHKSGQARVVIDGRHIYLGVHGSPESWEKYRQLLAEWNAKRIQPNAEPPKPPCIQNQVSQAYRVGILVERYLAWAQTQYPPTTIRELKATVQPLLALHGMTPIADFGPRALAEVQQAMASGSWVERLPEARRQARKAHPAPAAWCRRVVNARINTIKKIFLWGVSQELIPEEAHRRIASLAPLRKHHSPAREKPPVPPVPDEVMEQTLPHLGPVVGAMVRLQRLTGMRPGEVCSLRPCDLDRDSLSAGGKPIWVYKPPRHKGEYLDREAAIVIGPRAQEVLLPFLDRPANVFCFTPEESLRAHYLSRAKRGKQPPQAKCQLCNPRFTTTAYALRIRRACVKHGIPRFSPHQLRHSAEVEIEKTYGLDGARTVLRHSSPSTTAIYGQRDLLLAATIIAELG